MTFGKRAMRTLAAGILAASALLSVFIWVSGIGVPKTYHLSMGACFIALHVLVAYFIFFNPTKRPFWSVVAALLVVPMEVLLIFAGAKVEQLIKYPHGMTEDLCRQNCEKAGYGKYQFSSAATTSIPCSCMNQGARRP